MTTSKLPDTWRTGVNELRCEKCKCKLGWHSNYSTVGRTACPVFGRRFHWHATDVFTITLIPLTPNPPQAFDMKTNLRGKFRFYPHPHKACTLIVKARRKSTGKWDVFGECNSAAKEAILAGQIELIVSQQP